MNRRTLLIAGFFAALVLGMAGSCGDRKEADGSLVDEPTLLDDSAEPETVKLPPSPCDDLPDEERLACVEEHTKPFYESVKAFQAEFLASGADFHSLPVSEMMPGSYRVRTLDEVLVDTTLIIHGRVTAQTISKSGGSVISTIEVLEKIDGVPGGTVLVQQAGGPYLDVNSEPTLLDNPLNPLLRKEREYLLFLGDSGDGVTLGIAGPDGQFEIVDGKVASPGNADWTIAANGMPVEDFIAQVEAAVAASAQTQ